MLPTPYHNNQNSAYTMASIVQKGSHLDIHYNKFTDPVDLVAIPRNTGMHYATPGGPKKRPELSHGVMQHSR